MNHELTDNDVTDETTQTTTPSSNGLSLAPSSSTSKPQTPAITAPVSPSPPLTPAPPTLLHTTPPHPITHHTNPPSLPDERTFLSYLRLSTYLAIVGLALILSFHLKHAPSALELRIALPLGILFWILSLTLLGAGVSNYVVTVTRYGQRRALVQTGWKTQVVLGVVGGVIVGCCGLFLGVEGGRDT